MKNMVIACCLSVFWALFPISSFAIPANPLPPDRAFALTVDMPAANTVQVQWQIAPGYYLYAKKISLSFEADVKAAFVVPQGEFKYDGVRGRYEALSGVVTIPVTLEAAAPATTLTVHYQGCSEDGFCYPPMEKKFSLNLLTKTVSTEVPPSSTNFNNLLTDQNGVQALLHSKSLSVMLLIFMGLGLLLAFTPCVLPMMPILASIIVGQKKSMTMRRAFVLSVVYVLGSALTYALAGMLVAGLGGSIQSWLQNPLVIGLMSGLMVLLSLSLFGWYELRFPVAWQNRVTAWATQQQRGAYAGVFMMGVLSTLILSPCVTAPLVGVLMYIAQTGDMILGASALFAMGVGMGIPLILLGTSAGKLLPKRGPWMIAVQKMFGFLMLAMAIWLAARVIPEAYSQLLFGLLLVAVAFYVGIYLPRIIERRFINRSVGLVIGLFAVFIMTGGMMSMGFFTNSKLSMPADNQFVIVRNLADFDKQLSLAQHAQKPVLLDFYADWCASCVEMDNAVFKQPEVQRAIDNFVLLRIDLSANSADDEAMMKRFDVVAPPTILFFTDRGQEVNSRRIIGELGLNEFLSRISTFMAASCDKKIEC